MRRPAQWIVDRARPVGATAVVAAAALALAAGDAMAVLVGDRVAVARSVGRAQRRREDDRRKAILLGDRAALRLGTCVRNEA